VPDVAWLTETGAPLGEADWNDAARHRLVMLLGNTAEGRLAVIVNGDRRQCVFTLPVREGFQWQPAVETQAVDLARPLPGRSVSFMIERRTAKVRARKGS
jgi:glycogen operon protein